MLVVSATSLASSTTSTSASNTKRAILAESRRRCAAAAHNDDSGAVLVTINVDILQTRTGGRRLSDTPSQYYASKLRNLGIRSGAGDTSTPAVVILKTFRLLPTLAVRVASHVLEHMITDVEVELVEASCAVREPAGNTNTSSATSHSRNTSATSVASAASVPLTTQEHAPWALDRIDSCYPSCPAHSSALDTRYVYGAAEGGGAVIYVLDGGVRVSHTEFEGRAHPGHSAVCITGWESECTSNGGRWAFQAVVDDTVHADLGGYGCSDHGTHCAGSAASATYGVAKNATIIPVGVLNCDGDGWAWTVIAGLEWVVEHAENNGVIGIASLSLSGSPSITEDRAIAAATLRGISVVVAAGNEAQDACQYSPAREPTALTVAATTVNDDLCSFSNIGPCVDLLAPGAHVLSLGAWSDIATIYRSGTSIATPHVTGALAQLRASAPELSASNASAMLICLATTSAIHGGFPSTPTTANRFLFAGAVFSDPSSGPGRACAFPYRQPSSPPLAPPSPWLPPAPTPPPASCPDGEPSSGATCSSDLECAYALDCCNGVCSNLTTARCLFGSWLVMVGNRLPCVDQQASSPSPSFSAQPPSTPPIQLLPPPPQPPPPQPPPFQPPPSIQSPTPSRPHRLETWDVTLVVVLGAAFALTTAVVSSCFLCVSARRGILVAQPQMYPSKSASKTVFDTDKSFAGAHRPLLATPPSGKTWQFRSLRATSPPTNSASGTRVRG